MRQRYVDGQASIGRTSPAEPSRGAGRPFSWRRFSVIFGIAAVVVAALLVIGYLSDDEPSPGRAADTVSWSITISGSRLTLTGELPNGYPTETYLDGQLIDRDDGGDFSWDLARRVPEPVSAQRDMNCSELAADRDFWIAGADSSTSEDSTLRQLAYAQNAINLMGTNGC